MFTELRDGGTGGILPETLFSLHGSEIMGWQIRDSNILIYFAFGISPKWQKIYPLISANPERTRPEGGL